MYIIIGAYVCQREFYGVKEILKAPAIAAGAFGMTSQSSFQAVGITYCNSKQCNQYGK